MGALRLESIVFVVVFIIQVWADTGCRQLNGNCQDTEFSCPGGYRSNLCSGGANRRCCLPSAGDRRCSSKSGTCQPTSQSCSGSFQSGLCAGPANRKCCVPTDSETPVVSGSGSCLSASDMTELENTLIKYEKIKYTAYDAQPKSNYLDWTICVGFNLKRSKSVRSEFNAALPGVDFDAVYAGNKALTKKQCLALLRADLTKTFIPLAKHVTGSKFCQFPMNVKIAAVNAVYRGDLKYSHQTAKYIRAGQWCSVRAEYLDNQEYRNCHKNGKPGVCTRMDWNADQFHTMC